MKNLLLLFALFSFSAWAAPVNINSADAETLAKSLKGVGPKKAEAIVQYRQKNGDFNSPDDLVNVKGIGPKTLEINKTDILVSDPGKK